MNAMAALKRKGWLLLLLGAAAACGGEDPTGPDGEPDWVELGGGLSQFAPLDDGDTIELVFGPQGSWHVDLGARFGALPDGVIVTYRLWDDEAGEQLAYPVKVFVQPDGVNQLSDGSYARSGDRVIVTLPAPDVVGQTVRAELEAIVDGAVVRDERQLIFVDEQR